MLTIFPEMFHPFLRDGVLGRAVKRKLLDVTVVNIRDFAEGPHRETDDRPYGGGEGMVMKPEPIYRALESVERMQGKTQVILMSPQGRTFDQDTAWKLSTWDQLIFICGRYEGVDERVRMGLVDMELSVGDYILSGGELAAMVVIDAVSRLIPGVLGGQRSNLEDSFEDGLLEYPQYTRPRVFKEMEVPDVLLSGNHEEIRLWRRTQALRMTLKKRPDLLHENKLTSEDKRILVKLKGAKGPGS